MIEIDNIKLAAKKFTVNLKADGYISTGLFLYKDIEGNILYARFRLDHPTKDKYIRPLSRDKNGNWNQIKEPNFESGKPIYNLHLIAKEPDKLVFIVEGEKCADALRKLGILATTSGGATSAKEANWQILAGRDVWIWADNDDAGRQYANDIKAILTDLNCKVHVIDVVALNLPAKGDCVEWLAQFKEIDGRDATIADITALALVKDEVESDLNQNNYAGDMYALMENNRDTVNLHCAADIMPEAIQWMWRGWLAKGKFHILAGQAGTGKTTLAIALAATITKGGRFPDGSQCPKGSVLIWSGEDSLADTLVPRLMAADANRNKVHFVGDTTANYELRSFDPATDMQSLMLKAASIPDLALLIIDPIVNAVAGDSHKNGEVRRALQPVIEFCEKLNCAVLGITHFSKGGQGKDPLERVTGSLAFGALARVVLATAKINDGEKTKRIVCVAKCNVEIDTGGFEYDIQQKEVQAGILSSYAIWGDAIEGSARELLAEPDNREQGENGNTALDQAKDFLLELLADGEFAQKQIEADAKGASHSMATVRRAKSALKIISTKSKLDGCWYWKLPSNMLKNDKHDQDAHVNNMSALIIMPKTECVINNVMEF